MPFGGVLVVHQVAGHRESVPGPRVHVEGVPNVSACQRVLQPSLLRFVERVIDLGDADVQPRADLIRQQVRTVGAIGRQRSAMDGGGGGDAIGKRPGREQRVSPAHAIAQRAAGPGLTLDRPSRCVSTSSRIGHHLGPVDRADHPREPRALGAFARDGLRIERLERARPVIQVRHGHHVPVGRQTLRHAEQVRPDAEGVHVDDHRRPGPRTGRCEDVAVERAFSRFEIDAHSRASYQVGVA